MPSIDLSMPEEIHLVAFELFSAYTSGQKRLDGKAIEGANTSLLAMSSNLQELWQAVASLGALALTLQNDGDAAAADAIRRLIAKQAPHFKPIMEELEQEAGDGQAQNAANFRQMFGGDGPSKAAPKHDEAAPEGSVSLKSFLPNPATGGPRAAPARGAPSAPRSDPAPRATAPAPRGRGAPRGRASAGRPRKGRIDLQGPSGPNPRGPRGRR